MGLAMIQIRAITSLCFLLVFGVTSCLTPPNSNSLPKAAKLAKPEQFRANPESFPHSASLLSIVKASKKGLDILESLSAMGIYLALDGNNESKLQKRARAVCLPNCEALHKSLGDGRKWIQKHAVKETSTPGVFDLHLFFTEEARPAIEFLHGLEREPHLDRRRSSQGQDRVDFLYSINERTHSVVQLGETGPGHPTASELAGGEFSRRQFLRLALFTAVLGVAATADGTVAIRSAEAFVGGEIRSHKDYPSTVGVYLDMTAGFTMVKIGPRAFLTAAHTSDSAPQRVDETGRARQSEEWYLAWGRGTRVGNGFEIFVGTTKDDFVFQTLKVEASFAHPSFAQHIRRSKEYNAIGEAEIAYDGTWIDAVVYVVDRDTPDIPIANIDATDLRPGDEITVGGYGCQDEFKEAAFTLYQSLKYTDDVVTNITDVDFSKRNQRSRLCPGDSGGPVYRVVRDSKGNIIKPHTEVVGINSNRRLGLGFLVGRRPSHFARLGSAQASGVSVKDWLESIREHWQ